MKKFLRSSLAVIIALACCTQASLYAFAAGFRTEYVSEVALGYGNTADEAKKWLTDNGYEYVDNNLNEGADDKIYMSVKRYVYLGYKTTNDPDEAITDMKLMNMEGGYSVQDYQKILSEKKSDINSFVKGFISVLTEYRSNYKKGNKRALAAHDILNMIYDEDNDMNLGDLFLNEIKEEYTEDEYSMLTATEQKNTADLTTILMQGNAEIVLSIEQTLAAAADDSDTLWIERYQGTKTYDRMLDELVWSGETVDMAERELAVKYDETAATIAGMAKVYKEWLSDYMNSDVRLTDSEEEVNAYTAALDEEAAFNWYEEGVQYETLDKAKLSDGTTLLELFTSDEYDLEGEDRTLLYPLASVLTEGQRAGVQFLTGSQLVAMGFNTEDAVEEAAENSDVDENKHAVSVFEGVDRTIYSDNVALTGDAYKLQTSSQDKSYSDGFFESGLSDVTKILAIASAVTIAATIGSFIAGSVYGKKVGGTIATYIYDTESSSSQYSNQLEYWSETANTQREWSSIFKYAGIGLTVVSIIMSGMTLWSTYEDLKSYYHASFTPIPAWMVDQSVNDKDEKVFTYYKAAVCNREEGNFISDNNGILENFGDINGDVGKQWVALYTTTDKAAGDPIEADFRVQYGDSGIKGDYIPLSMFDESVAQNLTNKKAGYTYNDSKGGIYLFYNADLSEYSGSAISAGGVAAIAAGGVVLAAGIICLIVAVKKKKASAGAETPDDDTPDNDSPDNDSPDNNNNEI